MTMRFVRFKLFANLVADAYLEGAKQWQEKIRSSGGDKAMLSN